MTTLDTVRALLAHQPGPTDSRLEWEADMGRHMPEVMKELDRLAEAHTGALAEVAAERARQDAKWGEQDHPDGTGGGNAIAAAVGARMQCQLAAKEGALTWRDVMREEVGEAFAETDPAKLRAELIQVAAVAVAWAEAIDRRANAERVIA